MLSAKWNRFSDTDWEKPTPKEELKLHHEWSLTVEYWGLLLLGLKDELQEL